MDRYRPYAQEHIRASWEPVGILICLNHVCAFSSSEICSQTEMPKAYIRTYLEATYHMALANKMHITDNNKRTATRPQPSKALLTPSKAKQITYGNNHEKHRLDRHRVCEVLFL